MSELSNNEDSQTLQVLVIDDQPIVVESIRRLLATETDIEVKACHDPTLALSTAAELGPSVILQDLLMPDVDGLMLVKFFRAHPKTKDIPILVLSSKDEPEVKATAFSLGANDYLIKLPDPVELIARLRYHAVAYHNLLKRSAAEQAIESNKVLETMVELRTAELKKALEDLKCAQARLIHNEKMNSMGQLVAGIAHEVNNPINFIYGNLSYMNGYVQDLLGLVQAYQSQYPNPPAEIEEKLEDLDLEFTSTDLLKSFVSLRSGAQRIRNLVLSLRNFSRFDEAEIKTVDVHEGIESTLAMMSADLAGIEIEKDYGDLPLIECYAGQLNQVFMNIIRNAIDALVSERSPHLHITTKSVSDTHISIWIVDNGPGINPEIQDRIFDPFFTTREVGKGTGLGLSISHQIIEVQHGGSLRCYSVPKQGTKFLIELPAQLKQASRLPIAESTEVPITT